MNKKIFVLMTAAFLALCLVSQAHAFLPGKFKLPSTPISGPIGDGLEDHVGDIPGTPDVGAGMPIPGPIGDNLANHVGDIFDTPDAEDPDVEDGNDGEDETPFPDLRGYDFGDIDFDAIVDKIDKAVEDKERAAAERAAAEAERLIPAYSGDSSDYVIEAKDDNQFYLSTQVDKDKLKGTAMHFLRQCPHPDDATEGTTCEKSAPCEDEARDGEIYVICLIHGDGVEIAFDQVFHLLSSTIIMDISCLTQPGKCGSTHRSPTLRLMDLPGFGAMSLALQAPDTITPPTPTPTPSTPNDSREKPKGASAKAGGCSLHAPNGAEPNAGIGLIVGALMGLLGMVRYGFKRGGNH